MNRRDWMMLQALQEQNEKLEDIRRRQSWWRDFSSNVAGNAVWDGAVFLLSRLLRKL